VSAEARPAFLEAYAEGGAWARLFRSAPGFRSTRLFQDVARPDWYLTLDIWDTRQAYERFRTEQGEAYSEVDTRTRLLTLEERELAAFDLPMWAGRRDPMAWV
jgi:heme-degrading monooxygenase HmoA